MMRKKLLMMISIFLTIIFFQIQIVSSLTGLEIETISENQKEEIKSNLNISRKNLEGTVESISSFDVSTNGLIAVCNEGFSNFINVYDSNGKFLYGYSLDTQGSFGVEFKDDELMIYLLRSSLLISLDEKGNIIDILNVKKTAENESYWRNSIRSKIKKEGIYEYYLKSNNFLSLSNSKIIRYNIQDRSSNVILDFENENGIFIIIIFIFISSVFAVAVIGVFRVTKKAKEERKT